MTVESLSREGDCPVTNLRCDRQSLSLNKVCVALKLRTGQGERCDLAHRGNHEERADEDSLGATAARRLALLTRFGGDRHHRRGNSVCKGPGARNSIKSFWNAHESH